MAANLTGERLGQYEIADVIGVGGMATVYRALQASTGRDVALKVISSQYADDPNFAARFEHEARLFARLQHPHILPMYDFGRAENRLYLVMRLVDGGSLDVQLRRGALPLPEAARLFTQIAGALTYAHGEGVIHRDLKPNNILLDKGGSPYLTDFGIAKVVEGSAALTATGAVMGTPSYMAPEQWRGHEIDARTDIYALGVMLYEMLTGTVPFKGDTPYVLMYKHFDEAPLPPAQLNATLPEGVNAIIQRAMAKNMADRFTSANTMADALNAISRDWIAPEVLEKTAAPGQLDRKVPDLNSETLTASALADNSTTASGTAAAPSHDNTLPLVKTPTNSNNGAPSLSTAEFLPLVNVPIKRKRTIAHPSRRVGLFALIGLVVVLIVLSGGYAIYSQRPYHVLATLDGHNQMIVSANYNTDGSRLLTASADNTIKVWDTATNTTLYTLRGHTDGVYQAAWDPAGKRIASIGGDQTLRLWDATTGASLITLTNKADLMDIPTSLSWSPDGKQLAVGYGGGAVYLWDLVAQKAVLLVPTSNVSNQIVSWSPDGTKIALVAPGNNLEIVDPQTKAVLVNVPAHTGYLNAFAWTRDFEPSRQCQFRWHRAFMDDLAR